MRQTLETSWAMRCVQEMSVITQNKDYEDCNTTRTLTCSGHCWVSCCASCCFSGSWFSRCHWCRTPQRPASWFHSSTAFHHAYAYKVQSSFLLDVAVRLCPVIVNSICIPNSCIFHIAKTGLLRCCLYTPRRTAVSCKRSICNKIEWIHESHLSEVFAKVL